MENCIRKSKYLFMLVLFLWAGLATPLVKFYSPEYPYIFVLNILFLSYYYLNYQRRNIMKFLLLVMGYGIWYGLICLKYEGLQNTDLTLVCSAMIGYVAINVYSKLKEFFFYYETVLIFLCIISLIVWVSVSLFPFMGSLYDKFAIYRVYGLENSSYIIVGYGHQMAGIFHRNLGFAWEAGRFASFVVIGIFINLHLHQLDISYNRNRRFWILLVTLITTFSTTGFAALGGVFLFYFYNKSVISKIILVVVAFLAMPTIIAMPFIGDKIMDNSDYNREISNMMYSFTEYGTTSITPQRITGFYLEILNFCHDPLLGYNINENSYMNKHIFPGFVVWLSDGILQIFSKYGIFVGLFFYYSLCKSSICFAEVFKQKGKLFFALTFILISFSYDFWGTGLFSYLIFYSYYNKKYLISNAY